MFWFELELFLLGWFFFLVVAFKKVASTTGGSVSVNRGQRQAEEGFDHVT